MSKTMAAHGHLPNAVELFPFNGPNVETENDFLRKEIGRLRARLVDLEKSADSDPMVEVFNRRAFMRELGRAQAVNTRYNIPSSVLFFDLNGFKLVNDRFGHVLGDELLMKIGRVLSKDVRHCDMVARLGGDEFGVLLFKTPEDVARSKAAALACNISQQEIEHFSGAISVTASWGVAGCDPDKTPKQILASADEAMYQAKAKFKSGIDLSPVTER